MKQQVYVGSVAVNHSMEGGPIPDPVALPAGELGEMGVPHVLCYAAG